MHALVLNGEIIRTENFQGETPPTLAPNKGAWVAVSEPEPPTFDPETHYLSSAVGMVNGSPTVTYSVSPHPVPQEVGRVQAKIWLHRAGKLVAVQSYIDAANDAELELWWNEANVFRRDNPHVVALASGFDIDLDVAFREAARII